MVYKYQIETLEYLEETREKLEKLTDSRMCLRIGRIRDEYLNSSGTAYYEETRNLYFCINHESGLCVTTFKCVGDTDYSYGVHDEAFLRLDKNIFLKLNEFIDKIYKNKKEREEFHDRLNHELKALNKILGD